MRIGFAITCYDKFEEARIFIELIRKEFKKKYKISLCSNHIQGKELSRDFDIDQYIQAREIPYFKGDIHNPGNLDDRISIVLRSTDSVLASCRESLNMDVDYIVHVHSDAWCLSEEKLLKLIEEMKKLDKKFLMRSTGLEKSIIGAIEGMDDHFFIFEKEYAVENKVFKLLPEEYFPDRLTIHEILMTNFLIKYGLKNIWNYRNTTELLNYDGNKVFKKSTLRPVSYDPYYKFLHLNRASFPGTYGQILQAIYLKENTNNKSKIIESFIEKYYRNKEEVLKELSSIEKKYNKRLKFYLFSKDIIENREITYKSNLLKNVTITKVVFNLMENILKFIYKKLIKMKSKIRNEREINDIAEFYSKEIKLSKFVEDKWTKTFYYNKDIGLDR